MLQEGRGEVLSPEKFNTHLRWNIYVPQDKLVIEKRLGKLLFKSLDTKIIDDLKKDLEATKSENPYLTNFTYLSPEEAGGSPVIQINLKTDNVEAFSFYRDSENKYIVDFWIDEAAPVNAPQPIISRADEPAKKSLKKVVVKKEIEAQKIEIKKVGEDKSEKGFDKNLAGYRDFRYGAAFFWDYKALMPKFDQGINIERKAPDFLYPIKDREFQKDEKEAHLQLSTNLYRKAKYGLMYKSIKLYEQKYGNDANTDLNEYLKANAILMENLKNGNSEPEKMAISMLEGIAERTKNYDMAKAILKYSIAYYMSKNENIKSLTYCKKLYVKSKENFDYEESKIAAEGILNSLAALNQADQISDLLSEKTIQKLLGEQTRISYYIFVNLNLGKIDEVIRTWEEKSKNFQGAIDATILFNVAESYFRRGKYENALKLYDRFNADYSFYTESAKARLRMALIFEIIEKPVKETLALYKYAIDRSQDLNVRYEAQIRYAALRTIRNLNPSKEDLESRVFLKNPFPTNKLVDVNLKKLLWLVRLRTFIVSEEYRKALTYLRVIPQTSMKPFEARVFEADGAEVIYGLLKEYYLKADYPEVIRVWEVYKEKFIDKVALDPEANYIVAKSYLNMGLVDGFDRILTEFETFKEQPEKTFPNWIERSKYRDLSLLLVELQLSRNIRNKNWNDANANVRSIEAKQPGNNRINYYDGIIAFQQKKYKEAITSLEKYFVAKNDNDLFDSVEVAELLRAYTDSIYESGDLNRFIKVSKALLSDTNSLNDGTAYMNSIRERIHYLLIESIAATGDKSFELEGEIKKFKSYFKKSLYQGRMNYLLAMALLGLDRVVEGQQMLNQIVKDETVSDYIKELARSELSFLKLKERKI